MSKEWRMGKRNAERTEAPCFFTPSKLVSRTVVKNARRMNTWKKAIQRHRRERGPSDGLERNLNAVKNLTNEVFFERIGGN